MVPPLVSKMPPPAPNGASFEEMSKRYVEILGDALKIEPSPANYLADIDDGFYVYSYLRSWAFEAQLRDHLRTRFGQNKATPIQKHVGRKEARLATWPGDHRRVIARTQQDALRHWRPSAQPLDERKLSVQSSFRHNTLLAWGCRLSFFSS